MKVILIQLQNCQTLKICLVVMLMVFTSGVKAENRDLEIVGWIENARLMDPGISLKAKLDTGAETSSLDVNIIKKFRKDDKRWVRFLVSDRETGEEQVLVRERLRTVSIVRHDGKRQSRPVVEMKICVASRVLNAEVSLSDRSEFTYPLLLGRKALESFALVDPGNTFLSTPDCRPESVQQDTES
jgi:hypothetical protein